MAAFCLTVTPTPTPPRPSPLHSILQTDLLGLSLHPWRKADAAWSPHGYCSGLDPRAPPCLASWLSLMSQWPLLGTSVISHCSLRSLPQHPGCDWGPEMVAAPEGLPLVLSLLQAAWPGLVGRGQVQRHCPFLCHPHCSRGVPVLGTTSLVPLSLSPRAVLCRQGDKETDVYPEHAGT